MTVRELFDNLFDWYPSAFIFKWVDSHEWEDHYLDIENVWDCEVQFIYPEGGKVCFEVSKPEDEETEE